MESFFHRKGRRHKRPLTRERAAKAAILLVLLASLATAILMLVSGWPTWSIQAGRWSCWPLARLSCWRLFGP